MEKNGLAGICDKASGQVINAKPGPELSLYSATVLFNSLDKNPIVEKTAKPAKTPVKQSQDTTIHICLKRLFNSIDYLSKGIFTEKNCF